MSHFCLLADPAGYAVSDVDVLADPKQRDYWVKLFTDHFERTLESALATYGRTHTRQIDAARRQFTETLAPVADGSYDGDTPLGIIGLCRMREQALRDHGLLDPFRHIKRRENEAAIEQYPHLVRRLRALPDEQRWEQIIRGVFAGNIFDLGSPATMGYATDSVDFEESVVYADTNDERKLEFVFPVRLTPDFTACAGAADAAVPCPISAEGRVAQVGGKAVSLWNTAESSDAQPWWAWHSPERRVGLALFLAKSAGAQGALMGRDAWSASTYVRGNAGYTHFRLRPGSVGVLRHTMRFSCIEEPDGIPWRFRTWARPASEWAVLGEVEDFEAE